MSTNIVIFGGNLGADPVYHQGEKPTQSRVTFRVASDRYLPRKEGAAEAERDTTWMNVIMFGDQAETQAKYLKQGSQVLVKGRLSVRNYIDKDKNPRTSYEIVANEIDWQSNIRTREEIEAMASAEQPLATA